MNLTIEKLQATLDALPKSDTIPAKFRCSPTAIPWLKHLLQSMCVFQSIREDVGPRLMGMPIEEDADMKPNQVAVISAAGTVMETITI